MDEDWDALRQQRDTPLDLAIDMKRAGQDVPPALVELTKLTERIEQGLSSVEAERVIALLDELEVLPEECRHLLGRPLRPMQGPDASFQLADDQSPSS